jgi:hypothetical protein
VSTPLDLDERRTLHRKAHTAIIDALRALGGAARREAIITRALADGDFTARELAQPAPEGATTPYSGLVECKLSFALSDLKRSGLLDNPTRGTWTLAGVATETQPPAGEEQIDSERLAALQSMPYKQYLRTPEWQRTRAAALERANHRCSLDATHSDGLEVHHRTYERLGAELEADVIVLCHGCHQLHHQANGRPRRSRSSAPLASTGTGRKRSLLQRLFLAG